MDATTSPHLPSRIAARRGESRDDRSQALGLWRRNNVLRRYRVGVLGAPIACIFAISRPAAALPALPMPRAFGYDAFDRDRDAPPQERIPSQSDGVYGRFDGEVSLVPFAGAAYTQAGMLTEIGVAGYYLNTAGIQAKFADGRLFPGGAPHSVSTVSLALRPLFLLRWSNDFEQGPGWFDLMIDSVTLKVGGFYSTREGSEATRQGLETEISLGYALLHRAHGPWLSLAAMDRIPKITNDGHAFDFAIALRLEWSFSLGK